jgi:hypothetical protein
LSAQLIFIGSRELLAKQSPEGGLWILGRLLLPFTIRTQQRIFGTSPLASWRSNSSCNRSGSNSASID